MRYYDIKITNSDGGLVTPNSSSVGTQTSTYTSFVNGQTNPGALNVELDIPVAPFGSPLGGAGVRVWGISQQEISQATDLNGKLITVSGGMQKGLPLANPTQAGVLVSGYIQQAFGNREGLSQTLDLVIQSGLGPNGEGTSAKPINLSLNWKAGQTLETALRNTLGVAYPGATYSFEIDANITRPNDEVGYFGTLERLSSYVEQASKAIIGKKGYGGVQIARGSGNSFRVFDGSKTASTIKNIAFTDLIGQPTWIQSPLITFKTVMRADIKVGDTIKFPQNPNGGSAVQALITAPAQSQQPQFSSAFQGSFLVNSVHHFGNFRQANAESWVTVFVAAPSVS